jgi:hypothetical protein
MGDNEPVAHDPPSPYNGDTSPSRFREGEGDLFTKCKFYLQRAFSR